MLEPVEETYKEVAEVFVGEKRKITSALTNEELICVESALQIFLRKPDQTLKVLPDLIARADSPWEEVVTHLEKEDYFKEVAKE